ncbi:hypothetical protein [Enterococcus raffinosus]|nr:hypothetical protein [Enterococcus raffinosus]
MSQQIKQSPLKILIMASAQQKLLVSPRSPIRKRELPLIKVRQII